MAGVVLTAAQVTEVLKLAAAASAADGVPPLSEHVLLHLRYDSSTPQPGAPGADPVAGPDPGTGRDYVATVDGEIAAYAHLDPPEPEVSGELVVDPGRRRQGLGRALVSQLAAEADGHILQLWAHGDQPAAARLAAGTGFERFRALWQMRRPLGDQLAEPEFPAGRRLRTFVPGQDEDEWLSLNGRAFAKHPEQGGWTRHDLELREREPWFEPAGFFIAERDGQMAGFHWTKVHPASEANPGAAAGHAAASMTTPGVGEVYVVGVDPAEQGSGLGRALTLAGLRHLRDLGLAAAMLYVDEDNTPAIRMYESLGFTRSRTDAMYRRDPR
ncbi:MAG: mycothiol synthase [Actinomycetota bacterium]|nr:mycothiol synthase [Actinomycetota bacterium]